MRSAETGLESGGEMVDLFRFLAANTNVEWSLGYSKGLSSYGLRTDGESGSVYRYFNEDDITTYVHSHPSTYANSQQERDSMKVDVKNSETRKYNNYVYIPSTGNLFQVQNGKQPVKVKTIKRPGTVETNKGYIEQFPNMR